MDELRTIALAVVRRSRPRRSRRNASTHARPGSVPWSKSSAT